MNLRSIIRAIQKAVGVKADGIFGPVTAAAVLLKVKPKAQAEPAVQRAVHYIFEARTEEKLATLEPKAAEKFRPFIAKAQAVAAAMGCDYIAISGHRSYDEQDYLYSRGRDGNPGPAVTNARGGYSNHNFGIALDFGVFKGGRYLDGSKAPGDKALADQVHRACAAHAAAHGIEWGGSWRRFQDFPHYQIKTGRSMAQMRARVKAGRSAL